MKKTKINHYTDKEALEFHSHKKPGKIEIISSKNMTTKRDLALAYSPGVAAPVKAISEDPEAAYDYTSKGNLVAVVSNGSAILGMGNLGALASKPVMEGKAVLFKRFADIDSIDLEIDCSDANEIINSIKNFAPSFGGINLEDIAAPDCFIIEEKLKEVLDIPVFHDDQHGTAIITSAALINALDISKKLIKDIKVVVNGAGASAMACANLFKNIGVPQKNITMIDRKGVIYQGRENLNQWKSSHAISTKDRNLSDAIKDADVFLGLSAKGALTKDMVKKMAKNPIIFACANPDPEITPEEIEEVRNDAIIATGRSDYPNQVNNLIGFPYIFRGALDVRSKTINEEMKVAAVNAIANLAREDVPDEVVAAMGGERPHYGKDYIIPSTFDPRLISVIPAAVAKAAIDSGVARKPIVDFELYKDQLKQRLDPTVTIMQGINNYIKKNQKKIVFADGEDVNTLKAAIAFKNSKLGVPILIGKEQKIKEQVKKIGYDENFNIEIVNSKDTKKREKYVQYLFKRLQRENQSKTVKTLVLEGRASIPISTNKDYKPPPILQNYGKNSSWHEDSGQHPQGNNKRNGGTNNAPSSVAVEIEDKNSSKFLTIFNSNNVIKNDSTAVAKFVDFVGKSVLPRLGYLNRFEKKVLRFAIDLPSGEKLGVRLEKSGDDVSICFIAPNSEIRELLTSCKSHISDNLDSQNAPKLSINIFADYAEMDNFFTLAA